MKIHGMLWVLLVAFSGSACSQQDASYEPRATAVESSREAADFTDDKSYQHEITEAEPPRTAQPPPPGNAPPVPAPSVLIKTADCRLEVENIKAQVQRIEALVNSKQGYLGDLVWQRYTHQEEVSLTLRIPAEAFQSTLDDILQLAVQVDRQQINTQDATEEYVDIQSRLKTKKAVRDRYEEILRTKAKTVSDILETEAQIRRLQEEIEVQEGRLRYLSQRSALSTITLSIYEELDETAGGPPWWKDFGGEVGDSLKSSIRLLKDLFLGVLSIWPLLLLLGLLIWRRKAIWRRLRG